MSQGLEFFLPSFRITHLPPFSKFASQADFPHSLPCTSSLFSSNHIFSRSLVQHDESSPEIL